MTFALLLWPAGVLCGAAASGAFTWTPENVAKSLLCMVMSGPLLTGYTQVCCHLGLGCSMMRLGCSAMGWSAMGCSAMGLGGHILLSFSTTQVD